MAKDSITPEEKLLKIIEGPDVEKRRLPPSAKVRSISAASLKEWLAVFHIDKEGFKKFNLKLVNKIVAVICVIITVVWLFDFINTGVKFSGRLKYIMSDTAVQGQEERKKPIDLNIDEISTLIRKRNMFTFAPSKEEAQAAVNIGITLGNLKLVGILWSENPQAMIENSREQKTYFVSKGDKIGDVEVMDILRDKVVVGKGSEEWELR